MAPPIDLAVRVNSALARPIGPRQFARKGRRAGTKSVIACLGDSITHGFGSSNYVQMVQDDLRPLDYQVVNAGVNADVSYSALNRVDDVLACQPDVVTVLIGTNDVAAHIDDTWRASYMKAQHLPRELTLEWYESNLEAIVRRLQNNTGARIALIEIPMLGEDLESIHNQRVEQTNTAIHTVGDATGVSTLELHARLVAALPEGHHPPRFDGTKTLMNRALRQRLLLRRSWDDISHRHGLTVLTDQIHLNDRAGRLIAELIENFVLASE